jgi:hypothetical protein
MALPSSEITRWLAYYAYVTQPKKQKPEEITKNLGMIKAALTK